MSELKDRLEQYIIDEYFRNPPDMIRAMSEEPTTVVAEAFVKEWIGFSQRFPRWVGAIIARCPHFEVISFEIENLFAETVQDPDSDTNHYELLIRLGRALGLSREEIEAHRPHPNSQRAFETWWTLARREPWILGFTAINGLEILGDKSLPARYGVSQGTGLAPHPWKRLGLDDEDLEFFRVGDEADVGHGEEAIAIMTGYAQETTEDAMMDTLDETMAAIRLMLDGMYELSQSLAEG